jgi:hypothetical protein
LPPLITFQIASAWMSGNHPLYLEFATVEAESNVTNCSDFNVTAPGPGLPSVGTITVTPGGEYEPGDIPSITEDDLAGLYVDVQWGPISASGVAETIDGNLVFDVSGCGSNSQAGVGVPWQDITGSWCQEFKDSARQKAEAIVPAGYQLTTGTPTCKDETRVSGPFLHITLGAECVPGWSDIASVDSGGGVTITMAREADYYVSFFNPNTFAFVGGPINPLKTCEWRYPILAIPVDDKYIPSGQVQLGAPIFSTSTTGIVGFEDAGYWFGDAFETETFCVNPGPPTITFSRLP